MPSAHGQDDGPPDAHDDPITIAEITAIAQRRLPTNVWDYYASGADEQRALKRNEDAFDR